MENRLSSRKIGPQSIAEPIRYDRPMADANSHEIALVACANPSFAPYVRLEFGRAPWAPSIIEHEQAMGLFIGKMKKYQSAQPIITHHYCLYSLRFISIGSISDGFSLFGGDIDLFNSLALIHQLVSAENPPIIATQ